MKNSQELLKKEFIHLLSDTLALLGAEKRLVEDIKGIKETPFSPSIISRLRKYNRAQSHKIKDDAALLNLTFSYPAD